MSDYSTTKSYVLTAAGFTATNLMSALYDHFAAAPGLWRLKSGTSSNADGIIIEPKLPVDGYNIGISIRRNSTTDLRYQVDDQNSFTAAGTSASGAAGGSATVLTECTMPMTNIGSAKIAISETPDAVIGLFYTTLLSNVAQMFYLARTVTPDRAVYRTAPLLFNGVGCMIGTLSYQAASVTFLGGPSSATKIRSNGGSRPMAAVATTPVNMPIPNSPGPSVEIITAPKVLVYHDASTNSSEMGALIYIGRAAVVRANRDVIQHPTEQEAWMHVTDPTYETSNSRNVVTWEKGVAAPS